MKKGARIILKKQNIYSDKIESESLVINNSYDFISLSFSIKK